MSSLRSLSKHARALLRTLPTKPNATRAFHSPFKVLSQAPLVQSPAEVSPLYEKQLDHSPDPQLSSTGTRMYVVSEPDPANTPYQVPSGAYPTSAPYKSYPATEAPSSQGAHRSSTSSDLAHPITNAAPQNESGVMESSAVRYGEAPGEMNERGGSYGGLGLMDRAGTKSGKGQLADRNPPPDDPALAARWSKMGIDNAWKDRK
ncbi:uncharacterized protein LAESUDRAFT_762706 [Laetiporus sulphureus 93-53]|uniref:Uncharacterized protein n=1 Tax=Laetiporus sulphureus 93-53 TaxID=1314785 RepID=A0A165CCV9_9APHY|nr:uncharacterized protein LAESUDRAFT_762706 [Laetiporus sulphureus 93-53]KZT02582.1 hypothetical protein LAESUDRAFT_762706 [Laetiporus sulphureus 93-53]